MIPIFVVFAACLFSQLLVVWEEIFYRDQADTARQIQAKPSKSGKQILQQKSLVFWVNRDISTEIWICTYIDYCILYFSILKSIRVQ